LERELYMLPQIFGAASGGRVGKPKAFVRRYNRC